MIVRWAFIALMLALASPACAADTRPAQGPDRDTFVSVYGVHLHYREAGSGPVILLLHGLADDVHVWDDDMGVLAAHHRVIALDLPGFGLSDKPLLEYRPRTFVDFVRGFLDALRVTRASVVGNSLGGFVAALLALDDPQRVDRLVLVDAAGYHGLVRRLGPRGIQALRLATRADLRYLAPLTFHDRRYASEAAVEAGFAERMKAGDGYAIGRVVDSLLRGDDALDGKLRRIDRPTLIVWGRDDGLIPLAFGNRFAHDIPRARLVVLPDCGHMPQVECPAAFTAAVTAFLQ
jgi:pimeloyl-ACP methyl ester carboxylesterase